MTKLPDHARFIGAVAAWVTGWLVAAGGVVGIASSLLELGWSRTLSLAVLCGCPPSAIWLTRRVSALLRVREIVPPELMKRRYHGSLAVIADSERRTLRSIGNSAYDVAARTGVLLAELITIPGVRVFLGARPAGTNLPPVPHTISAGRQLILIESVAWPGGRYHTAEDGRIHCDGVYIGQSVAALMDTVRAWQRILKQRHQVSAFVVVHPVVGDGVTLPEGTPAEPDWVLAQDAVHRIRRLVRSGREVAARNTIAALLAGSADRWE